MSYKMQKKCKKNAKVKVSPQDQSRFPDIQEFFFVVYIVKLLFGFIVFDLAAGGGIKKRLIRGKVGVSTGCKNTIFYPPCRGHSDTLKGTENIDNRILNSMN